MNQEPRFIPPVQGSLQQGTQVYIPVEGSVEPGTQVYTPSRRFSRTRNPCLPGCLGPQGEVSLELDVDPR